MTSIKKILALVTSIILLSGCGKQNTPKTESDNVSSTAISSAVSSVPQSTQSKAESRLSSVSTKSTAVSSYSSVPKERPVTVKTNDIPTEISDYISSLDNGDFTFVDFTVNDEPDIITDVSLLGDSYDKALGVLKDTDDFKYFAENFSSEDLIGMITENVDEYFDESGQPAPIFKRAITDDFDRDGIEESFVMAAIAKVPDESKEERWFEREYLIYVGKNGATLLSDYYSADIRLVLDYGCGKQIVVFSDGWHFNDSKSAIFGVKDGKAKELYGGRLGFKKTDCFLYSNGQNFIGDFAVYDTVNNEYLAIQGKTLSPATVKAMDKNGTLKEVHNAVLVGGKYYIINTNGVYTYENGEFVKSDKKVRASATPGSTGDALNTLADIDYDKAVSSMITPE